MGIHRTVTRQWCVGVPQDRIQEGWYLFQTPASTQMEWIFRGVWTDEDPSLAEGLRSRG